MLNKDDLKEFKKIWLEEFGEEISDDIAEIEGNRLVNLFAVIYKKIPILGKGS